MGALPIVNYLLTTGNLKIQPFSLTKIPAIKVVRLARVELASVV
jgi:hypothetical protein